MACNCICYQCEQKLEAVQGQRDWYFRHSDKSTCIGNNETALHQFAKFLLYQNRYVNSKKKTINYTEPVLETVIDKYRSDVSATYNNEELHFEIVVHHDLTTDKKLHYRSNKINCIRIDLSDPLLLSAQPDQIKYAVLQDKENKSFIQWNEDKVYIEEVSNSDNHNWLIAGLIFLGSIFLFRKSLFGQYKRRSRFRR
ncbi:hypothetical protein DXN05_00950 [Deminuibacter soli]|uniref:Uncharacterized protein n=1 Tax=Deminuibacter soli TaxID=2291815 RepID=A0A3E1NP35_9BACT|nr:hypothetical protein DXN05_00950 [Deminuibacter soli]